MILIALEPEELQIMIDALVEAGNKLEWRTSNGLGKNKEKIVIINDMLEKLEKAK